MILKPFDVLLIKAVQQPENSPKERLHLFQINDISETLNIEKEMNKGKHQIC